MSTDSGLMEFDSLFRESYRVAIENKFGFKHDLYGGYGLFTWENFKLILGGVIQ